MLELIKGEVIGIYDSCLAFRHGPKSFLDKETLVVFMSNDAYVNRYEVDLINEMVKESRRGQILVVNSIVDILLVTSEIELSSFDDNLNTELLPFTM